MLKTSVHKNSLEEEARHILEECRIVVPGVQALIGFQMVAVFNDAFYKRLAPWHWNLHIGAICLVVMAMVMLMTPPAYHRIAEPGSVSFRFLRISTELLCWAMSFLRLGLVIEVFIVASALGFFWQSALLIAGSLFLVSWVFWTGLPRYMKRRFPMETGHSASGPVVNGPASRKG
jgi:hypothetical protein